MHFLRVFCYLYSFLLGLLVLFLYKLWNYEGHFNLLDLTYYPLVSCEVRLSLYLYLCGPADLF